MIDLSSKEFANPCAICPPSLLFIPTCAEIYTTIDGNSATSQECSQSVTYEHCDGYLTARRCKLNGGSVLRRPGILRPVGPQDARTRRPGFHVLKVACDSRLSFCIPASGVSECP